MDETLTRFLDALRHAGSPVGITDVERLCAVYPFFTLPALTLLQREGASLPEATRATLLRRLALNAPDAVHFQSLADPDRDTWMNFYPPERPPKPTTSSAIDTFLATYGHTSPREEELLERMIFNPVADYSAMLAREEEESLPCAPEEGDTSQDALISSFILKAKAGVRPLEPESAPEAAEQPAEPAPQPAPEPPRETPRPDDSSLSESLAKIYIRRRRYDKAYEIIHTLSLNNPKKSVYFADQLRFLRKLMLLESAAMPPTTHNREAGQP